MSFDSLVESKLEELRVGVLSAIETACSLSKDGYAHGSRVRSRDGFQAKAKFSEKAILIYPRRKWIRLDLLSTSEILTLSKLLWAPSAPYHPLEMLALVAEADHSPSTGGFLEEIHQACSDEHATDSA